MTIRNPIVTRMAMLLDELEEEPLRAAYMVVSQLHELQTGKAKPVNLDEIMRREQR